MCLGGYRRERSAPASVDCVKKVALALAGAAQWIEGRPANHRGSLVQSPVRAHAWIAGQVPIRGHATGNHTLKFLSISLSLPLSKNK